MACSAARGSPVHDCNCRSGTKPSWPDARIARCCTCRQREQMRLAPSWACAQNLRQILVEHPFHGTRSARICEAAFEEHAPASCPAGERSRSACSSDPSLTNPTGVQAAEIGSRSFSLRISITGTNQSPPGPSIPRPLAAATPLVVAHQLACLCSGMAFQAAHRRDDLISVPGVEHEHAHGRLGGAALALTWTTSPRARAATPGGGRKPS